MDPDAARSIGQRLLTPFARAYNRRASSFAVNDASEVGRSAGPRGVIGSRCVVSQFASPSAQQHREQAPESVGCAVVTVSDTRTLDNDRSGQEIVQRLAQVGHRIVERLIVPDEPELLESAVRRFVDLAEVEAILLTGGTGIAPRDQTPETIRRLLTAEIPGYGELFRLLSYQEIGAAAMLSRALGGVVGSKVVLLMPGSTAAVRLAMEKLICPELAHLVEHARR